MSLAKKVGLNVPHIEIHQIDKRSVYLIERFDRNNNAPIPFASGLTMTGCHESDFASWSYFGLVDAIVKYSAEPERDLEELFRRLVFNIAVYNNDDHLRNFGFLHFGNNRWRLSPLYDVVPSVIHTETYSLAMTCGAEGKKASYTNALSMSGRFRISNHRAREIVTEIKDVVAEWKTHFRNLGVKESEIKMLRNSFRQRK